MLKLSISIDQFAGAGKAWVKAQEQMAVVQYRAYTLKIYEYIVMHTPQYTGGTVASWKFNVGQPREGKLDFGTVNLDGKANLFDVPDEPFSAASGGFGHVATQKGAGKLRGVPDKPQRAGNPNMAAIGMAFQQGVTQMRKINSLSQVVAISNPVTWQMRKGERPPKPEGVASDYTATAAEEGGYWLRGVNLPGNAVNLAVSYFKDERWFKRGLV